MTQNKISTLKIMRQRLRVTLHAAIDKTLDDYFDKAEASAKSRREKAAVQAAADMTPSLTAARAHRDIVPQIDTSVPLNNGQPVVASGTTPDADLQAFLARIGNQQHSGDD